MWELSLVFSVYTLGCTVYWFNSKQMLENNVRIVFNPQPRKLFSASYFGVLCWMTHSVHVVGRCSTCVAGRIIYTLFISKPSTTDIMHGIHDNAKPVVCQLLWCALYSLIMKPQRNAMNKSTYLVHGRPKIYLETKSNQMLVSVCTTHNKTRAIEIKKSVSGYMVWKCRLSRLDYFFCVDILIPRPEKFPEMTHEQQHKLADPGLNSSTIESALK